MPESQQTMDAMAAEIFELYQVIAAFRSRQPNPEDLSETEFIALDALAKTQPLTIGDIQKKVGVVPAQMSRIIRALEEQGGRGYVECKINPQDRRRIDVYLTEAGQKAHGAYRSVRLKSMYQILEILPPEDRLNFMRILNLIRTTFEKKLNESS